MIVLRGIARIFFLGGYKFLLHYSPIHWRHRLQLLHKIIFKDWFLGVYIPTYRSSLRPWL